MRHWTLLRAALSCTVHTAEMHHLQQHVTSLLRVCNVLGLFMHAMSWALHECLYICSH